jgi:hypothetical protein
MKPELNHGKVIDFVEARNLTQLSRRRLEIDLERYQTFIDDNELSEKEKADFVNALWTVIVAFVDLGYGVHPVQSECAQLISLPSAQPGQSRLVSCFLQPIENAA